MWTQLSTNNSGVSALPATALILEAPWDGTAADPPETQPPGGSTTEPDEEDMKEQEIESE